MNDYQGPEWAMKILAENNLVVVPDSYTEDRFHFHKRRCGLTERIWGLGWFTPREVEVFLVGYETAIQQAALDADRG